MNFSKYSCLMGNLGIVRQTAESKNDVMRRPHHAIFASKAG
jgi:hypothetical protein